MTFQELYDEYSRQLREWELAVRNEELQNGQAMEAQHEDPHPFSVEIHEVIGQEVNNYRVYWETADELRYKAQDFWQNFIDWVDANYRNPQPRKGK